MKKGSNEDEWKTTPEVLAEIREQWAVQQVGVERWLIEIQIRINDITTSYRQ